MELVIYTLIDKVCTANTSSASDYVNIAESFLQVQRWRSRELKQLILEVALCLIINYLHSAAIRSFIEDLSTANSSNVFSFTSSKSSQCYWNLIKCTISHNVVIRTKSNDISKHVSQEKLVFVPQWCYTVLNSHCPLKSLRLGTRFNHDEARNCLIDISRNSVHTFFGYLLVHDNSLSARYFWLDRQIRCMLPISSTCTDYCSLSYYSGLCGFSFRIPNQFFFSFQSTLFDSRNRIVCCSLWRLSIKQGNVLNSNKCNLIY